MQSLETRRWRKWNVWILFILQKPFVFTQNVNNKRRVRKWDQYFCPENNTNYWLNATFSKLWKSELYWQFSVSSDSRTSRSTQSRKLFGNKFLFIECQLLFFLCGLSIIHRALFPFISLMLLSIKSISFSNKNIFTTCAHLKLSSRSSHTRRVTRFTWHVLVVHT